jgi:uncharacterized protein
MSHATEGVSPIDVTLSDGLLGQWQRRNRARTIPHVIAQLREAGNLANLRRLVEDTGEPYRGRYPFLDTDIFKTLEGIAYEIGRGEADDGAIAFFDEAVTLIQRAQRDDGYLNSWFQSPDNPVEPWEDLVRGHELYNLGHLLQAAVAARRQAGDGRLLAVARRFADLAVEKFGKEDLICGHPEVEMALVELTRETGDDRYAELAAQFIDRRGRGLVGGAYFQDAVPLRELPSVTGHAVRMAYLAAGAADVHLHTGDTSLLAALDRLWRDMVDTKLYVTGGLGSRHSDEAIGDRYELPAERAYSETCAAIATMQWAWRMFLATHEARFVDVFETVLYNAYAVGLSADGTAFFYDNPLQRRPDHVQEREPWFVCPCCPPNVVRWMSQLSDHIAVEMNGTLLLANYTAAEIRGSAIDLRVETDYPWRGAVRLTVTRAPSQPYALKLRVPAWCQEATVDGAPAPTRAGWVRVERRWAAGDTVELDFAMPVRAHGSHPYLDATRGCVSVARGPLVYCAEQVDNESGVDDLLLTGVGGATTAERDGAIVVTLPGAAADPPATDLYPAFAADGDPPPPVPTTPTTATLVPYFTWGNREAGAMRVWIRTS